MGCQKSDVRYWTQYGEVATYPIPNLQTTECILVRQNLETATDFVGTGLWSMSCEVKAEPDASGCTVLFANQIAVQYYAPDAIYLKQYSYPKELSAFYRYGIVRELYKKRPP